MSNCSINEQTHYRIQILDRLTTNANKEEKMTTALMMSSGTEQNKKSINAFIERKIDEHTSVNDSELSESFDSLELIDFEQFDDGFFAILVLHPLFSVIVPAMHHLFDVWTADPMY